MFVVFDGTNTPRAAPHRNARKCDACRRPPAASVGFELVGKRRARPSSGPRTPDRTSWRATCRGPCNATGARGRSPAAVPARRSPSVPAQSRCRAAPDPRRPRAGDGNDRRRDPRPFDAPDRVEHQPIERHQRHQINRQADHHERRVGHLDARRFQQRFAGRVRRCAEIVPAPMPPTWSGGRSSRCGVCVVLTAIGCSSLGGQCHYAIVRVDARSCARYRSPVVSRASSRLIR